MKVNDVQTHHKESWKQPLLLAAELTFALRAGLGIVIAATWGTAEKFLPPIQTIDPVVFGKLSMPNSTFGKLLLGTWVRWDAVHHLNLAMRGYFDLSVGETVFYPLFAGLTRVFAEILGNRYIISSLLVSTIATIVTLTCLKMIGDRLFGPATGTWSAIALACYPLSLFLIAPYSESLFLAFTLGAFLAAYKRSWWLAALLSFLASLTRGPGIAASVSFFILAGVQWRESDGKLSTGTYLSILAAVIAPIAGGGAFLLWRAWAGFPSMASILKQYVGTSVVDPLTGLITAFQQWIHIFDLPTTLDILSLVLFVSILILMCLRPQWRKWELIAYMLVSLVALVSRNTTGAASLKGLSRYLLVLFPAFLIAGNWLSTIRRPVRFVVILTSSILLIVAGALYALWFFLG